VAAVERDVARELVRFVRAGCPLAGLSQLQRREAVALLVDTGEFWRLTRDEQRFEVAGFASFGDFVVQRYGISVGDALVVMRAAGRYSKRPPAGGGLR
jgi:hypothetical protein